MPETTWGRWGCAVCGRRAYLRANGGYSPDCQSDHLDAGGHFIMWRDGAKRPRIPARFASMARGVTIQPVPS